MFEGFPEPVSIAKNLGDEIRMRFLKAASHFGLLFLRILGRKERFWYQI